MRKVVIPDRGIKYEEAGKMSAWVHLVQEADGNTAFYITIALDELKAYMDAQSFGEVLNTTSLVSVLEVLAETVRRKDEAEPVS